MFKKGNNIFSLLVIVLSIFMTSSVNVVNAAEDIGVGSDTSSQLASNQASDETKSTTSDSSNPTTSNSNSEESTKNWGDQFITQVQLQDADGKPMSDYDINKRDMHADWQFSTDNNVIHAGDTITVSVPGQFALNAAKSAPVYSMDGTAVVLGESSLDVANRTVTVTFNSTAAQRSQTGPVIGSFWLQNVGWDSNVVISHEETTLDWTTQGTAVNNPNSTSTVEIGEALPSTTELLNKYGGFLGTNDNEIQWTVRINYAGKTISNAVYEDILGSNQTLLQDDAHPITIVSGIADHTTGKINPDSPNLLAGKTITKTADGFSIDLGTITHSALLTYYTKITDIGPDGKHLSSSYGNTGKLLSNKTVIDNYPSNIHSTVLGSEAKYSDVTSIVGRKTWDVPDGSTAQLPDSIVVNLIKNGDTKNPFRSQTINKENNNWNYEFNNLPSYDNEHNLNSYSVFESPIAGYTTKYNTVYQNDTFFYDIINIADSLMTNVTVKKIWHDGDNEYNKRPDKINVGIFADGNNKQQKLSNDQSNYVDLTAKDSWSHTWTGFTNPSDIWYISESNTPVGYIKSDTTSDTTGRNDTIVNTLATNLTVKKSWDDNDNQDHTRPSSVKIQLYANGTAQGDPVELDSSTDWTYKFENLKLFDDNDKEITYTVKEVDTPSGYITSQPTYTTNDPTNVTSTITNKLTSSETDKRSFTVNKVWKDTDTSTRPNSITLHLLANNAVTGDPVTIKPDKDGNWPAYTWNNLAKNDSNGQPITYSVQEDKVDNYDANVDVLDNDASAQLTNTYIENNPQPETTSFTVNKKWVGDNAKQPDSVSVQLYANDTKQGEPVTLNADNHWSNKWSDLATKDSKGNSIKYSVQEVSVPTGYTASIVENTTNATITNIYQAPKDDKTDLNVTKVWSDNDNQDGSRPKSIQLQLLADGKKSGEPVTVTAKDNWSHDFTNLTKGPKYTVQEILVPKYSTAMKQTDATHVTITNTHTPKTPATPNDDKTNLKVTKIWSDSNNQDKLRPSQVTVHLLANGKALGDPVILNSANDWSHIWNNLEKDKTYTVSEDKVSGYSSNIDSIDTNNIQITNTHTPTTISHKRHLTVTKVWQDNNDQDKLRPSEITVHLIANGQVIGQPISLNANNNWSYTWNDLDKETDYSVREDSVSGYTSSQNTIGNYITITNTENPNIPDNPDNPGTNTGFNPGNPVVPSGSYEKIPSTNNRLPQTGSSKTNVFYTILGILVLSIFTMFIIKKKLV